MPNPTLAWMVVAALLTGLATAPVASAEVVAGFESGADLQRWLAQGKIRVQRTEGPTAPEKAGAAPPAGGAAGSRRKVIAACSSRPENCSAT